MPKSANNSKTSTGNGGTRSNPCSSMRCTSGDAPPRILGRGRLLPNIIGGTAFNLQWADPLAIDDDLIDDFTSFVLDALLAED